MSAAGLVLIVLRGCGVADGLVGPGMCIVCTAVCGSRWRVVRVYGFAPDVLSLD